MPVVIPIFAAIGTAVGASAATAAATGAVITATTVSAGATAYGAYSQKKAGDAAAQVDTASADYNARYDLAAANQLDLDTQQNVRTARADNAVYLSRQAASYASAGVLGTTGSPLHAEITNAGRMEQQIQQEWVNSQQKQQSYAAAARVGQLEGAARAQSDRMSGSLAVINGATKLADKGFSDYQSGIFSGLGSQKTAPTLTGGS